jgi:hypothetical protein
MPLVYNRRNGNVPRGAKDISRRSRFGNPFILGVHGDRDEVCDRFEAEVLPTLDVSELRGEDLVCWCAPLRCHGDSILRKANK